jgi:MOSC domain-containing protein YiiM
MFEGQLVAIYVGKRKREDLQEVDQVEAVPGRGLLGDRYFRRDGAGSPQQEVTLIEAEAIEALARDADVVLRPAQARRNLLTRGVPLNHLVGREFSLDGVVLRGLRLCEPCSHLEAMTFPGIIRHLCHRGGLRAQIVQGGILRAGAAVRPHGPQPTAGRKAE